MAPSARKDTDSKIQNTDKEYQYIQCYALTAGKLKKKMKSFILN